MGRVLGRSPHDFKITRDFILYIDNYRQDVRAEIGLIQATQKQPECICMGLLLLGQRRIETILGDAAKLGEHKVFWE
jgi:hypothetical protein